MQDMNIIIATGGTLWQSFAWIEHCFDETFSYLCKKYPNDSTIRKPTKEELYDMSHSGRALDDNIAFILGLDRPDLNQEAHAFYRITHDTDEMLRSVKLYPQVLPMLFELKEAGARLFAASEKKTSAMEASLRHLGIRQLFTHVQGAEAGGSSKGKVLKDLRVHMWRDMGIELDGENTVFIDGRSKGLRDATQAGVLSLGASWGGASAFELKSAGAVLQGNQPLDLGRVLATKIIEGRKEGETLQMSLLRELYPQLYRQDVSPDNTLLLEGRSRGVEQALREGGYLSIAALWGGASERQMQKAGAAWVAPTPHDVFPAVADACRRPGPVKSIRETAFFGTGLGAQK